MRILIVDDNQYACALASAQLKKLGFGETISVSTGAEAILQLQSEQFDALLTDWYMPDVSGAGLLSVIRDARFGDQSEIPVIVMTAYASHDNVERALALKADQVIVKPVNSDDLSSAFAKAFKRQFEQSTHSLEPEVETIAEEDDFALL